MSHLSPQRVDGGHALSAASHSIALPGYRESRPIYSHTGLRGIAALTVFIAHIYIWEYEDWSLNPGYFHFFMWQDYAVDLFFILSGFILNWVYLSREVNWSAYLRARAARILPLYYVTTLLFLPIRLYDARGHHTPIFLHHLKYVLVANTLLFSGCDGLESIINPAAWSVNVEVWLYITLFPCLVLVARKAWFKKRPVIAAVGSLLLTIVLFATYRNMLPQTIFDWHWFRFERGILGFALGFLLCSIFRRGWGSASGAGMYDGIIAASLLLFVLSRIGWLPEEAVVFAFPPIVYFSAFDRGRAAGVLKLPLFQWLGDISYSIYLWHIPVIMIYAFIYKYHLPPAIKQWAYFPIFNCVAVACLGLAAGTLSYEKLESPARDWIRKIGAKKKSAVPGSQRGAGAGC